MKINSNSPGHEAQVNILSTDSSQPDELQYEDQNKATEEKHIGTREVTYSDITGCPEQEIGIQSRKALLVKEF